MIPDGFAAAAQAHPGERIEYYRGFIGGALFGFATASDARRANALGASLYLSGLFDLVQCRYGYCDYGYFAIRRRHKDPQPRIWSAVRRRSIE
jgi:hypothetical protein